MIDRRQFCVSALTFGVTPGIAWAQTGTELPRIGVLSWWSSGTDGSDIDAELLAALREFGWIDGTTARIEFYWAGGNGDKAKEMAAALVQRPVNVIVAQATPAALIAKAATSTIPIVFRVADPLAPGLVTNLARPGGNLTGASIMSTEISGKRLELLREIVPGLNRVAFLGFSRDPNGPVFMQQTVDAARKLGIAAVVRMLDALTDYEVAVNSIIAEKAQALVVQPIFVSQRSSLAMLGIQHKLPMISDQRGFAIAGFPLAYGADPLSNVRAVAAYVDRILRGANPGDLPIQQPTEFRLIINVKSAAQIGLVIPYDIIARADEIIE